MAESLERDLYRDTPVRLLGYANEVGESFRPLVHVNWVRFSYGIASAYVLADTWDKTKRANEQLYLSQTEKRKKLVITAADTLMWQSFASVIVPGYTINRICALSLYWLSKKSKFPRQTQKYLATGIGLTSIPFIFKPIDELITIIMDATIRKLYQ